ncbi:MAG: hypothetical protein RI942_946 [Pseudomonadota bacterium]
MFPLGVLVVSLNGALSCQAEIYHAKRGFIVVDWDLSCCSRIHHVNREFPAEWQWS